MRRNKGPSLRDIALKKQSKWARQSDHGLYGKDKRIFDTAVVFDVISNPAEYLEMKFRNGNKTLRQAMKSDSSGRGVTNKELIDLVPRNTILAFPQDEGKMDGNNNPTIFLPFFPPHLCFPVKPGEHVWVFYDYINEQKFGFWLFRKPGYRQLDDINFTALNRVTPVEKQNQIYNKEIEPAKGEENFLSVAAYSFPKSSVSSLSSDEIVSDSVAYRREFIGEPVPRYTKKCGDLVLQGSNNTLITLGTDRSYLSDDLGDKKVLFGDPGSVYTAVTDSEDNDTQDTNFISQDNIKLDSKENVSTFKPELAGAIELVVGRGISNLKDREKELKTFDVDIDKQLDNSNNDNLKPVSSTIPPDQLAKKNVRSSKADKLEYYEHTKESRYTGSDYDEDVNEGNFQGLNDTS